MPKYKRGDVVLAAFFYQESRETKRRPVVILEAYNDFSYTCMITGTDGRTNKKGLWVTKDSKEGIEMNLEKDSFISAERTQELNNIMLIKYMGYCPLIDELEELL
jgi:mRNA-degrading endonuclease toxin of MazEF toxin-antitoxin module